MLLAAERHRARDRRRHDARDALEPLDDWQVEPAEVVGALEAREVAEDLRRDDTVGLIPGLDALQPVEAGEEEPRADQQHDGHRHLRDDERRLQAPAPRGAAARRPGLFQRGRRTGARHQRRQRAKGEAGQDRQAQREQEHRHVDVDVARPRGEAPDERREPAEHQPRHDESEHAAAEGEQHALGEQLARQLSASSAERHAQRQLALAMQRPREREAGDVGAREQQDEQRGAHDHQQHRTRVAGDLLQERHGVRLEPVALLVDGREVAVEPVGDHCRHPPPRARR